jgi:hypothetical protein
VLTGPPGDRQSVPLLQGDSKMAAKKKAAKKAGRKKTAKKAAKKKK